MPFNISSTLKVSRFKIYIALIFEAKFKTYKTFNFILNIH